MKSRLLTIQPELAIAHSLDLCARLMSWDRLCAATAVMAYVPLPGEADIRPVLGWILGQGKRLYLPRVDWNTTSMQPARVDNLSDLVDGRYGILEPPPSAAPIDPSDLDAILVPGLAFDTRGNRLGRGAGF